MSLKRPNKRVIKKKSEIVVMPVFNRHNMSRCYADNVFGLGEVAEPECLIELLNFKIKNE
jgi:hypothetical protein